MKLKLEHEINKAEKFVTGMLEIKRKMKSVEQKEVEGSLESTNQLIKMLSGDKEAEELKVYFELFKKFYDNIAE